MAWAAGAVALAIAAFFALGGRRARWIPLPAETRIVLPVLAVLALLSTRVDPAPRAAVLTLCAGGALLSLLSGARLRALAPVALPGSRTRSSASWPWHASRMSRCTGPT